MKKKVVLKYTILILQTDFPKNRCEFFFRRKSRYQDTLLSCGFYDLHFINRKRKYGILRYFQQVW